uniref:Uncharacterized protein n=1 Tax=Anguilla anguilla TaxID=7936 RepID=A0A0E9QH46_ANGAN
MVLTFLTYWCLFQLNSHRSSTRYLHRPQKFLPKALCSEH